MILQKKSVFLLEDDPINFSVIKTLLRKNGATVLHDSWGDTTLKQLMTFADEIDLILLDIMLPGKVDGYDVLNAIRQVPELSKIPVAFVSASDPDSEMPKAKALRVQGYISKPIDHIRFPQQLSLMIDGVEVWDN